MKISKQYIYSLFKKGSKHFITLLITFAGVYLSLYYNRTEIIKNETQEIEALYSRIQEDIKQSYNISMRKYEDELLNIHVFKTIQKRAKISYNTKDYIAYPKSFQMIFENNANLRFISDISFKYLNHLLHQLNEIHYNLTHYDKELYKLSEQHKYDFRKYNTLLSLGYNIIEKELSFQNGTINNSQLEEYLSLYEKKVNSIIDNDINNDVVLGIDMSKVFDYTFVSTVVSNKTEMKVVGKEILWDEYQKSIQDQNKERNANKS